MRSPKQFIGPTLQELIEARALAHDVMDCRVARVREEMERAEARRLQPPYVRRR